MKRQDAVVRAGAVLALLSAWQLVAAVGPYPAHVLPGPAQVLAALGRGLLDGSMLSGTLVSLKRLAIGYALASTLGILIGIAMGRIAMVERSLGTLLTGLQTLPSICWMPLALLWFGLDEKAILFVVAIASVNAVSLAVRDAVSGVPRLWVRAARNMGETGLRLWLRVLLPAALPGTITALRMGWSFAWRALLGAELLFVAGGLGQVMHVGRELNDMAQVMATMLVVVALGLLFDGVLLGWVEARMRKRWGLV